MTPQIFLDFNGVLDSSRGHYGGINFDPSCVDAFNSIAKKYPADIIVISSWRLNYSVNELQQILTRNRLIGTVIGKTPEILGFNSTRGDEIYEWRSQHGPHNAPMLILEDYADVDPFEEFCVRPKPHVGLSASDVPRALSILKKQVENQ